MNEQTIKQNETLAQQVADLADVYQPIFGHPELSTRYTRSCEDRFAAVLGICKTLEAKLQRPVRVLDLGCAQGFFSLNLAKHGAIVHGVDYIVNNVAVCRLLAAENPGLKVSFEKGYIEQTIAKLTPGQYDIVLGLSVFHHVVYRVGTPLTQHMLSLLAENIAVGIYEMAQPGEPTELGRAQPQDPRCLMDGYAFVHEFARNGTHVDGAVRPAYVASNKYWFLNGETGSFDKWWPSPRENAGRFFAGEGKIAALRMMDRPESRDANVREHVKEIAESAPILYGQHEYEAWLVRAA